MIHTKVCNFLRYMEP